MKQIKSIKQISNQFVDLYGKKNFKQYLRYQNVLKDFKKNFGGNFAYFSSSSGRVELVGNHTDHNGGKVLACAVSLDIICAFLPTKDSKVVLRSSKMYYIRHRIGKAATQVKEKRFALSK